MYPSTLKETKVFDSYQKNSIDGNSVYTSYHCEPRFKLIPCLESHVPKPDRYFTFNSKRTSRNHMMWYVVYRVSMSLSG